MPAWGILTSRFCAEVSGTSKDQNRLGVVLDFHFVVVGVLMVLQAQ